MDQNKNIEIRLATPEEAEVIAALLYESFVEYKFLYTQHAFAATTPGVIEIKEWINSKTVWVAVCNNKIAGTISLVSSGPDFWIRSVAVATDERGRGIGKALMTRAEQLASKKGFHSLKLTTTPFLYAATRLYQSFGFKQCGHDDLYGTPLIKMTKNLERSSKNKINKNDYAK